uniref:5'-nucleotidase n=3 Tax=Sipha flava TaxID=143950 RepID=A0A2S2QIH6_9HEMI
MDKQIAEQVDDIDLVIGGHTNTFLYNGKEPDIDIPQGTYPFWVQQTNTKRKVPVVQAFHISKYLGKLWLEFDEEGELIKSYGNPVLLDSSIEQDAEMLEEINYYQRMIESNMSRVVGSTSVLIDAENCRLTECNMGNFLTDSFVDFNIRRNIKTFDLKERWTDAPIAIMQGGGIRSSFNPMSMKGNITYSDLLLATPFNNLVGKITIKGSDIWNAFEFAFRRYSADIGYGEFLQVSGLKVVVDLGQPPGKRVQSVYARCGNCVVPIYEKLDLNGNYTVIMSHYLAYGGDGHKFQQVVGFRSFGATDLEIVEEDVKVMSPLRPEVDGRIVILNADKLQDAGNPPPQTAGGRRVSSVDSVPVLIATVACLRAHV